jgi:hypothetical protein
VQRPRRFPESRNALTRVVLCALFAGFGCGDEANDERMPGDPPGAVCKSDHGCPARAWLCFAVGFASSCDGGGLCSAVTNPDTGVPDELTCAQPCASDEDCAAEATATTCLLGCATRLFDGHCVTPAAATELLEYEFCESPSSSTSIAGASY